VFLLAGTRYAIPIRNVMEMDTMPRTTWVPNVPSFVRGVTNVRGEIISVLDLRSLFGLERWEFAERGRILIVRTADQQTAALAVDEVRGTASLSLHALETPTGPIHDKVMSLLLGVGEYQDQVLNVLDVDKMFRTREIQQFTAN
jgi:purine-binding chemotaxis protein CheW